MVIGTGKGTEEMKTKKKKRKMWTLSKVDPVVLTKRLHLLPHGSLHHSPPPLVQIVHHRHPREDSEGWNDAPTASSWTTNLKR